MTRGLFLVRDMRSLLVVFPAQAGGNMDCI